MDERIATIETPNAYVKTSVKDRTPTVPLPDTPQGMMVIGPRVTLHFITDAWSNANTYQYYDCVNVDGTSYIAIKDVPSGIEIANADYWIKWNDPNAQVALLQNTVAGYDARITAAEGNASTALDKVEQETTRATEAEAGLQTAIDGEVARATEAESGLQTAIDGKAQTMHAAATTTYGVGTQELYGHLKVTDTDDSGTAALGVAASPQYVQSKVNSLDTSKRVVVLIGDSYLLGTHSDSASSGSHGWDVQFEADYNPKQIYKFGNGGAGFWNNGTTSPMSGMNYNAMITYAASQIEDTDEVTDVVFQGGWNDVSNYSSIGDTNSYVTNALNNAHEKFPNARLNVIFTYCGNQRAGENTRKTFTSYQNMSLLAGANFNWTYNLTHILSDFTHDGVHPSKSANNFIGGLIAATLQGMTGDYTGWGNLYLDHNGYYARPLLVQVPNKFDKGASPMKTNIRPFPTLRALPFEIYTQMVSPNTGEFAHVTIRIGTDGILWIQDTDKSLPANFDLYGFLMFPTF